MRRNQYEEIRDRVLAYFTQAHIIITEVEKAAVEVADFGLEDFEQVGLSLITYVNTERCCAKELVLFPGQTCPEHLHPSIGGYPGKEETFRVRYGKVYLYVDGEPTEEIRGHVPENGSQYYTAGKEIILYPGQQFTLTPNTRHWFQAGEEGAVVSEFSTTSYDEADIFTDVRIKRIPSIEG
ncbi:MAG: D-lyxose ketol-isomerase [Herbinix sp.]|jgi:D-lyxose ketol-isomerase|nr:D-lyxose ketol-isomerase [Herbinix sp.]